jgi:hypothetical protein
MVHFVFTPRRCGRKPLCLLDLGDRGSPAGPDQPLDVRMRLGLELALLFARQGRLRAIDDAKYQPNADAG